MEIPDPWPLRHLVLRTPRLELRPDDDAGLHELVAEAHRGIHPPEFMPFGYAWTDAPAAELGPNTLRHFWAARAEFGAANWRLNFLVRLDGAVIGTQQIGARDFAVCREFHTGSWLGLRHQGRGLGTEMRAAVLAFAFDHLGAVRGRSGAVEGNAASLGVSRRLGYLADGTATFAPRGVPVTETRLLITGERFAQHRPLWTLEVAGLAAVRDLLGAG